MIQALWNFLNVVNILLNESGWVYVKQLLNIFILLILLQPYVVSVQSK